jgi:DNA modification methylase
MSIRIIKGDCRDVLRTLDTASVQTCITSPPYWGLRNYDVAPTIWSGSKVCKHDFKKRRWYTEQSAAKTNGSIEAFSKPGAANAQRIKDGRWREDETCIRCGAWRGCFGLEPTYQMFVEHAVEIFREVRRVLRSDGTLWLNLGDSYCSGGRATWQSGASKNKGQEILNDMPRPAQPLNLKPKDLIGIPWRVAFALQEDGWYLRQDIIWSKPNPMPESVTDRCTKAHEYLFLLTKNERYYFDAKAIKEPVAADTEARARRFHSIGNNPDRADRGGFAGTINKERNKRSVWTITTRGYPDAHFATFPPALIEPCIRAGSPIDGIVLDPFAGAGTTGLVAKRLGRSAVLIELNPKYADMAKRRIKADQKPKGDILR